MKEIFQLINPDNTIGINRRLAHALGLDEAVVYGALLAKYAWYEKHEMLTEDGWFYSTSDDLRESTTLSKFQQRRCIDVLENAGLIRCRQMGMPAKRYFSIVDDPELLEGILASVESRQDVQRREQSPKETARHVPAETEYPAAEEPSGKECGNFTPGSEETSPKTIVNKNKDIKPELDKLDARSRIRFPELAAKYGEGFAMLAADVVAEGIAGAFTLTTDGRTVDQKELSQVFRQVDIDTVSHVADFISGRNDIRSLRAYLRSALFTAVGELSQKPRYDVARSGCVDIEMLEELRAQYS